MGPVEISKRVSAVGTWLPTPQAQLPVRNIANTTLNRNLPAGAANRRPSPDHVRVLSVSMETGSMFGIRNLVPLFS